MACSTNKNSKQLSGTQTLSSESWSAVLKALVYMYTDYVCGDETE